MRDCELAGVCPPLPSRDGSGVTIRPSRTGSDHSATAVGSDDGAGDGAGPGATPGTQPLPRFPPRSRPAAAASTRPSASVRSGTAPSVYAGPGAIAPTRKNGARVRGEDRIEVLDLDIGGWAEEREAGVVDQDVDIAGVAREPAELGGIADVGANPTALAHRHPRSRRPSRPDAPRHDRAPRPRRRRAPAPVQWHARVPTSLR